MKKLLALFSVIILFSLSAKAQNLDSLLIEDIKELDNKIDNKLNFVLNTLFNEAKQQQRAYDSLYVLHQEAVQKLNKLGKSIVSENDKTRDSLDKKANTLSNIIGKRNKKDKVAIIIQYILFGFLFLVIFYLMIILRISRRESIEYLLSQTDGLREQNYEILERAEELKKIKKALKGLIKDQKLEDKEREKAKKKTEKKAKKQKK